MKIHLNDMIFYGYHGVYPEERKLGQRFIVTLTLLTDDNTDLMIKHLEDTVDYTKVFEEVKNIMELRQFMLLENCANEILNQLLSKFDLIKAINIRIEKPGVPINGNLSSVAIEMFREK